MTDLFSPGDQRRHDELIRRGWQQKWNAWQTPDGRRLVSEDEALRELDEAIALEQRGGPSS